MNYIHPRQKKSKSEKERGEERRGKAIMSTISVTSDFVFTIFHEEFGLGHYFSI